MDFIIQTKGINMKRFKIPVKLIELFCKKFGIDPSEINSGWCYQFAFMLKNVYGKKVTIIDSCGHVFVEIGNRYYDSQHPFGVECAEDLVLPCLCGEHDDNEYWEDEEESIERRWNDCGGSGCIQWKLINKIKLAA